VEQARDARRPVLGAHLARLETTEMLRQLLRHAPDMTIAEPTRVASNVINGIARLPVRVGVSSSS
jgi:cytochrome P450